MKDIQIGFSNKELRAVTKDDGSMVVAGYPVVFNSLSELLYHKPTGRQFREIIKPNKIEFTPDVRLNMQHKPGSGLARTKNGRLTYSVDDTGVYMEATLRDTASSKEAYARVQDGDIDAMSFEYHVLDNDETWTRQGDGTYIREVRSILIEAFSLVEQPAYPATSVIARAADVPEPEAEPVEPAKPEEVSVECPMVTDKKPIEVYERKLKLLELE